MEFRVYAARDRLNAELQTSGPRERGTPNDMHAPACACSLADRERDHLVTVVFPELRERVEQLGLEFFDVDPGQKRKKDEL